MDEYQELCKKVYERLGWETEYTHEISNGVCVLKKHEVHMIYRKNHPENTYFAAYDTDYVLGKLPPVIQENGKFLQLVIHANGDSTFHLAYMEPYDKEFRGSYITNATSLRSALLKLTLALADTGLLEKEG